MISLRNSGIASWSEFQSKQEDVFDRGKLKTHLFGREEGVQNGGRIGKCQHDIPILYFWLGQISHRSVCIRDLLLDECVNLGQEHFLCLLMLHCWANLGYLKGRIQSLITNAANLQTALPYYQTNAFQTKCIVKSSATYQAQMFAAYTVADKGSKEP